MTKTLFSIGHGYSAQALAPRLLAAGWQIIGTTRSPQKAHALAASGVTPLIFPPAPEDAAQGAAAFRAALAKASHVLSSVGPDSGQDPVLAAYGDDLAQAARHLKWVGYLSSTGVYGHHGGDWVDETTPPDPGTTRGQARAHAEKGWRDLAAQSGLPLHVFRLAGIYGPGRGPFSKLRAGTAKRVIKPGQFFSRIHVDDIATVLAASINNPAPGTIYNVADDLPAPPEDVLSHAAHLLSLPPPPLADADMADLSPQARAFYAESKRVSNTRIRQDLGVTLAYPDYHSGLAAILDAEGG